VHTRGVESNLENRMRLVQRFAFLAAACAGCFVVQAASGQAPVVVDESVIDSVPEELRLSDEHLDPSGNGSLVPQQGIVLSEDGAMIPNSGGTVSEDDFFAPDESTPCCDDGSCPECAHHGDLLFSWLSGVRGRGWIDQGFTWNPESPADRFNTPVTFNDRSNDYQLNQLYLILEKPIDPNGCKWDLGGRVDLLWGSDYYFTEAFGLEMRRDGTQRWNSNSGPRGAGAALYGLAMPQLYAEVFAPIWQGFSVKMGHFYTIMGYESVMAPENFFYSHSYTFQYGEPFTHTGLMTTFQASRGLVFQAGFHRGWNAWEGVNDQLSFLGGVHLKSLHERTTYSFTITHGHYDPAGQYARTAISNVFRYELTPCSSYVVQFDYGNDEGGSADGDASWYGLTNYLYHELSPTTELGMRLEWFHDSDNARVLGIANGTATGMDYGEITLGLNWRPLPNLRLRPELRWDTSDVVPPLGATGMFDDFTKKDQFLAAIDMIIHY